MAKAKPEVGPDYTNAPTSLKRGMPQSQHNGLYGLEAELIRLGVGGRVQVTATLEVADIKSSEAEHSMFPLVEWVHIEPIRSAENLKAVQEAQEDEYKTRTGADQLNFDGLDNGNENEEPEE